jgi:DNA-binding transcriptional ArsR family regulator
MAKESFMLVSLKEEKAKKLAQVMANPTCTRILEHLAGKDATESQIAKDLDIPLSTVHYNLQQLVDAKLVINEEFHYSEKGREVNHYKLANKYIIIAPQEDDPSFLQHLKKYLPVAIITAGLAVAIKLLQAFNGQAEAAAPRTMMAKSAADTGAAAGVRAFADTNTVPVAPVPVSVPWWQSPVIDYFIAGAVFVLLVMIITEAILYWRRKRRKDNL